MQVAGTWDWTIINNVMGALRLLVSSMTGVRCHHSSVVAVVVVVEAAVSVSGVQGVICSLPCVQIVGRCVRYAAQISRAMVMMIVLAAAQLPTISAICHPGPHQPAPGVKREAVAKRSTE